MRSNIATGRGTPTLPSSHRLTADRLTPIAGLERTVSEYVQNNAKVYTLRVLRDPSCDESLMQMTWSEAEQPAGDSGNHDLFATSDKNSKLPCYRTTAEDYQKALERGR